jgi:uncharacterized protein (TIRG00374 family)
MKISKKTVRKAFIYIIAVCCIAWILRGVRFDELIDRMRSMNPWWLLPAVILDVITTVLHGIRWRFLLRPIAGVKLIRTVQAIYTGLFANEILPVKVGEFVRGFLISRRVNVSFASILPSMIAERIFDGSLLVLGFGLSTLFVSIPREIITAAGIVAAVLLTLIIVLTVLSITVKKLSAAPAIEQEKKPGPGRHIASFIAQFLAGLRLIRISARSFSVFGISILYFSSQVLAYWLVMKAYGLQFSIWVPAVVLIIVRLGTALPNAPANIGPFQFFCVLALMLFGVEKTTATGFAIVLWLVFSIPIFVLGFAAFITSGLSLSELRRRHR